MTNKGNRAGKSTRTMAVMRMLSALITGLFGILFLAIIWALLQNSQALEIGGLGILFLLGMSQFIPEFIEGLIDKSIKAEKQAIRGARAEEQIGDILANLSDDFFVMDDIPYQFGNIDHIVIGRNSGIFLIETKSHHGTVTVTADGLLINDRLPEKDFIKQTLRNTFWLRDEVTKVIGAAPWINSVIVFTNAFVPPHPPVKGVRVINRKFLLTMLQRETRSNLGNVKLWEAREKIRERLLG